MSYDVSLNSKRARDHFQDQRRDCDVECYCFDGTVFDQNITYNVGGMFRLALGRPLRDFDGAPAVEACSIFRQGQRDMEDRPDVYKAMNPPNGWGSYEGALGFLRELADACAANPESWVRIS